MVAKYDKSSKSKIPVIRTENFTEQSLETGLLFNPWHETFSTVAKLNCMHQATGRFAIKAAKLCTTKIIYLNIYTSKKKIGMQHFATLFTQQHGK